MVRYTVDASVILKWILGEEREPDHKSAMRLLEHWAEGKVEISAPILWQYEVGNFLGRESREDAMKKMNSLLDLGIKSVNLSGDICGLCFAWMREAGVTFYDASYLAVAHKEEATLVTADAGFVRKMGKVGGLCLLKDLQL